MPRRRAIRKELRKFLRLRPGTGAPFAYVLSKAQASHDSVLRESLELMETGVFGAGRELKYD